MGGKKTDTVAAEVADTVAAGAIKGAGAALDAGGEPRDVAAATIGGAAAATAEVVDQDEHGDDEAGAEVDAIDREISRIAVLAENADFEGRTLKSDIRDHLIEVRKQSGKPWSELLEQDQRRLAQGFEHLASIIVRRVTIVVMAADAEASSVHATLKSYGEDGGFKLALTATSSTEHALALHDMVKQDVIVRLADPTSKVGTEPVIERDQQDLGFEGEEAAEHPADDSDLAGDDDEPGPQPDLVDDDITREAGDESERTHGNDSAVDD